MDEGDAVSLSTGRMKLYSSMKTLRVHWDQVRDVWNDAVSREFEEKIWAAPASRPSAPV